VPQTTEIRYANTRVSGDVSVNQARYAKSKLPKLESLNSRLDILRYQTRILFDFGLVDVDRYEHAGKQLNAIGSDLGGWMKQQRLGPS
jgi:hypothetical protein